MLVGAGENGDIAVLLDAHRQFGADQIEAFGAHMAAEQAHAGDANFRFRRARHHGAVGIAHHDVAHAHRGAAIAGALDLRAADLDFVMAAEILLDRRGEPGRGDVELDGAVGEPPPQRDEAQGKDADHDGAANADPADQALVPGEQPPVGQ